MTETHRKYQQHPVARKREIVEASLRPGVSVAVLAREYDINANQIWAWRKLYREGRLGATKAPLETANTRLLAVDVLDPQSTPASAALGRLEITLGQAKLCVSGALDPALLRTALTALLS
jgi:transposase